jgi:hypothetical protein
MMCHDARSNCIALRSRRDFLKWSGKAAAGTALFGPTIPRVHAQPKTTQSDWRWWAAEDAAAAP